MIDITLENFEPELIRASVQTPVLLDIWAPWCGPCKSLSPVLEKLETAYAGRFLLAKLNSDEEPEIAGQLSQAFGVRSIPFCVMFVGGQPVDGFVGALPEAQIRAFLDKHVPSADAAEAEEEAEEAEQLAAEGDTTAAIEKLEHALATAPGDDAIRAELVKQLIDAKRLEDAQRHHEPLAQKADANARAGLPVDARAAALGMLLEAHAAAARGRGTDALAAAIAANKRDFDARFERAQRQLAGGHPTEAMDELLEILMRDKEWGDQRARKLYVAILELMTKPVPKAAAATAKTGTLELAGKATVVPTDPVVDAYRRKLSMALF
ncbi:MAG TPA: tetratricopeptide repeat protein [Methylibium sp.]|uniref:tetratricopeptide repeat protein n=1 Tax=Methylibium sp. TaxID=2067992 RepID=UPI002DB92ACB|nr:tetratricopeptide repeat protein [Methylibium sp.]HEU4458732.1 tetratricopeptide repeat protein [Methylibium sp.]